jgi:hypothetical protein
MPMSLLPGLTGDIKINNMKKLLFIVIVGLIGLVNKVNAQNAEFGLKAGLNVAGLHFTGSSNLDSRASVYVGGLAHIHVSKYWAVQPELVYSCQGAKQNFDGREVTYRLNYVTLPVLLQYMFDNGFRLQTGPQLGLLASAKRKSGGTITDIKNDYTTADFSWSFGASYLTNSGIGIDARYNLGINNINNTGSNDKLQNRVFQVGLFYQFKHS